MDDSNIQRHVKEIVEDINGKILERLQDLGASNAGLDRKRLRVLPFRLYYLEQPVMDVMDWKTGSGSRSGGSGVNPEAPPHMDAVLVKTVKAPGKKKGPIKH